MRCVAVRNQPYLFYFEIIFSHVQIVKTQFRFQRRAVCSLIYAKIRNLNTVQIYIENLSVFLCKAKNQKMQRYCEMRKKTSKIKLHFVPEIYINMYFAKRYLIHTVKYEIP